MIVVFDPDKVLKCKFMLYAGAASTNNSLAAVFNQHRGNLLKGFIDSFDSQTKHLPSDLILPVLVYVPFSGAKLNCVLYEIFMPTNSFLFKKIFCSKMFNSSSGFVYADISLNDLFKISALKAFRPLFGSFSKLDAKHVFYSYYHSILSYRFLFNRKNFFYLMFYFVSPCRVIFYRLELSKPYFCFFKN